jgi:hypothetical protein
MWKPICTNIIVELKIFFKIIEQKLKKAILQKKKIEKNYFYVFSSLSLNARL